MKKLLDIIKKTVVSIGILYAYNMLMYSYNIPIPINIITIAFTTIMGVPGFIGLIIFYLINFT